MNPWILCHNYLLTILACLKKYKQLKCIEILKAAFSKKKAHVLELRISIAILTVYYTFLHYRTIKLDVNLHRFNICYWMSFSKQHGQELLAHSFVLHSCNDLTLVPIVDGLFHRPAANWCVRYLSCDLTAAKVWLQSARQTADEVRLSVTACQTTIHAQYISDVIV